MIAWAHALFGMAGTAVATGGDGGNAIEDAGTLPGDALNDPSGNVQIGMLSSYEFWLSVVLLLFGLIVIAIQLFVALKRQGEGGVTIETVIRLTMVSLIIVGAMVLIAAGYSSTQIGPAMGLFGTIAGYLIGKQDRQAGE